MARTLRPTNEEEAEEQAARDQAGVEASANEPPTGPEAGETPLMDALVAAGLAPRGPDREDRQVFNFAQHRRVVFSEWVLPDDEDARRDILEPVVRGAEARAPGSDWDYEDEGDALYSGRRAVFEALFGADGGRLVRDFDEIPEEAAWTVQHVDGKLMPVLEGPGGELIALLPDSAEHAAGALCMPDPDGPGPRAGPRYMSEDTWFEDCGDGGMYVLAHEGDVLLLYVDGPGDMVGNRYRCPRGQWLRMWMVAFGDERVGLDHALGRWVRAAVAGR